MVEVQVNIDCADAAALRAFYCAALGYQPHAESGPYKTCVPAAGARGPKIVFQEVPEPKAVKNRLHFDLIVDDLEAEVARFISLGATRAPVEEFGEYGCHWIVMLDPEGNEFCLCDS